jgi:penicillin-binding protein 2
VDPKTGGVLAMISSPTFKPKLLAGSTRKKHIAELLLNPALPLYNRTVSAIYSPGSTFKTLQALIALHEGVIETTTRFSCTGAFYGCGSQRPMQCLDKGVFDLRSAITVSDNTYFANVMQRVINNPKYPSVDSSLAAWNQYMYSFGLGHKLGVDVAGEAAARQIIAACKCQVMLVEVGVFAARWVQSVDACGAYAGMGAHCLGCDAFE